jgi:hypothetical protein|tara:strand:- start:134 stop:391 length:258 start_codon:yes stop_codon:yes gene_type:complete
MEMKKLNIPSASIGFLFALIGGVLVYLFLPPPSTVSAQETVYANTCATSKEVKKVEQVVGEYNDHILYELASIRDELQIIQLQTF